MATRGTRNTEIDFGGFEISVSLKKAHGSRDLKTEVVDSDGVKITNRRAVSAGSKLTAGQQRAVRLAGDSLIRLPQPRLDAIAKESQTQWEKMQVLEAIDYRQVPTERIVGSYWLQPSQGSARTLALLAEALRRTEKVAVVKWISTSREKLGIVRVRGAAGHRALLLSEVAFSNDFLTPDEDALEINHANVDDRSVQAAVGLIESFARQAGDTPEIDAASDTAVDARLALFAELTEAKLQRELADAGARTSEGDQDGELVDLQAARGKAA